MRLLKSCFGLGSLFFLTKCLSYTIILLDSMMKDYRKSDLKAS